VIKASDHFLNPICCVHHGQRLTTWITTCVVSLYLVSQITGTILLANLDQCCTMSYYFGVLVYGYRKMGLLCHFLGLLCHLKMQSTTIFNSWMQLFQCFIANIPHFTFNNKHLVGNIWKFKQ
jgi:hypothetical protein